MKSPRLRFLHKLTIRGPLLASVWNKNVSPMLHSGASINDLAVFFRVSKMTIQRWKNLPKYMGAPRR